MVFTFTSMGDTSVEAQRIFKLLPHIEVAAKDLATEYVKNKNEQNAILMVVATHEDMVKRKDGKPFDKKQYYKEAESNNGDIQKNYIPIFDELCMPYTSVLINAMYWDDRYPRLLTNDKMNELCKIGRSRLLALGDITCDPNGGVEFFSEDTPINDAYYYFDPISRLQLRKLTDGYYSYDPITKIHTKRFDNSPKNMVLIYGVNHIPAELPRDASEFFGSCLLPYVDRIARKIYSIDYEHDEQDKNVQQAMTTYRGKLTPHRQYLAPIIAKYVPDPDIIEEIKRDNSRETARYL
jgi:alpha-aminoadipic semialdehyde synthase